MTEEFDIPNELKKIPTKPGVYLMHDRADEIIYVGKAVNLRNRVRQYFRPSHNEGIRKDQMVKRIARFEYIVTDSELEALILECNLIKEHRPKYNTMLRDDKTYPYIKVTLGEEFPRVLFSRTIKKDKSRYFGPYTSASAVKETIELLRKLFGIRSCSRVLPRDIGKERPCLNYHIHQCKGPCQGLISKEEYAKQVEAVLSFLSGNQEPVVRKLQEQMKKASEEMEFEQAIALRELLSSIRQVADRQKMTSLDGEDKDIIALASDESDGVVQVFFVRDGRLIGREHFHVQIGPEDLDAQVIEAFLTQFYAGTPYIPREIMIQEELPNPELMEGWLSQRKGQRVTLRVPKKGAKEKLVELAHENAALVLNQDKERIKREEKRTVGAQEELAGLLGLVSLTRMEAFDISNTNGFESVGSMVVYENGKPKRSDYRKFRLRTVTGPDDYASMDEVLTRRFTHGLSERKSLQEQGGTQEYGSFTKFPDLIMMDGGKGQVNVACRVLEKLGLSIPVCGMVKDDHHRTRGLYFHQREIPIAADSACFHLITRIQDEAHRFAIEYHRSLRSGSQVHSVLDDIPGIGPARRKALMKEFSSLDEIREADQERLASLPGMNEQAAKNVITYLKGRTV